MADGGAGGDAERPAPGVTPGDPRRAATYDFVRLRWLCPCAYCRGEMGQPGWLDSSPTLTGEQTRLVSMEPVGGYAVAPTWGDGHHTGFYTFTSLRTHCPCPECTVARAAAGHPDAAIPKGAPR